MENGYIPPRRPAIGGRFPPRSLGAPALLCLALLLAGACWSGSSPAERPAPSAAESAFLDTLQARTFRFFWEQCEPGTRPGAGSLPHAVLRQRGRHGLRAHGLSHRRGARLRGPRSGRGPHAADPALPLRRAAGARAHRPGRPSRLLLSLPRPRRGHPLRRRGAVHRRHGPAHLGALFCQSYFDAGSAAEVEIRALADSLYLRAEWDWASVRPPTIGHGWTPEAGHLPYDWRGYNEAMLVYLLALGSPTPPRRSRGLAGLARRLPLGRVHGPRASRLRAALRPSVRAVWIDFRGIRRRRAGRPRHRLLRELAPRDPGPARLRAGEPRRLAGLRPPPLGPDRLRRTGQRRVRDRGAAAPLRHLLGPGRLLHRGERRRHRLPRGRRRLHRLRPGDRPPDADGHARGSRRASLRRLRLPRCAQSQLPARGARAARPRGARGGAGSTPTTSASIRARSWR